MSEAAQEIKEYEQISMKIDDLVFDKTNPNKLTKEQMVGLRESMSRFGYLTPIIIDQNNMIADGEHRVLVYKEYGRTEIPAFRLNLESEMDRRILRQVMNKLRGKHDSELDALELEMILKSSAQDLKDLSKLIAQDENELKRTIAEYSPNMTGYREIEGVAYGMGSLAANWGIPPFSVLDRRTQTWQERRRAWLNFGIASEQGREQVILYDKHINIRTGPLTSEGKANKDYLPTVSIFDPVLAEILIRWFCIPSAGARIIDPFSGGSVRGIVSSFLGHEYTGMDLSSKQIEANDRQYDVLKDRMPERHRKPVWIAGDSYDMPDHISAVDQEEGYDMLLTSPPYFHIEHYSDDPNDLNNLSWDNFKHRYSTIIKHYAKMMKKDRFVCWNVGNARDSSVEGDGFYVNQPALTTQAFEEAGFKLYNELVLIHPSYSLPFRTSKMFVPKRVVPRQHEMVLVYYNGSKDSVPKIDPKMVVIPQEAEGEASQEADESVIEEDFDQ